MRWVTDSLINRELFFVYHCFADLLSFRVLVSCGICCIEIHLRKVLIEVEEHKDVRYIMGMLHGGAEGGAEGGMELGEHMGRKSKQRSEI